MTTKLPITLRTSRWKTLLLLFTSVLFVVGGLWIASKEPLVGYSCAGFFGLGVIIFAIQLLPNSSYLHLTSEGFTFRNLFRSHTVPWHLATEFAVIRVSTKSLVAWNYPQDYLTHSKARTLSTAFSGYQAALPDTYGMRPQALAELLSSLRRQYATSHNA